MGAHRHLVPRPRPETAAAIHPPAGPTLLRRAEAATGGAWPEDLRAWYRLADGTERITAGGCCPSTFPYRWPR